MNTFTASLISKYLSELQAPQQEHDKSWRICLKHLPRKSPLSSASKNML